jgi:sterol desaturase/sphingolipid hydroxylase (fatty acid hydroxylase superfamily)
MTKNLMAVLLRSTVHLNVLHPLHAPAAVTEEVAAVTEEVVAVVVTEVVVAVVVVVAAAAAVTAVIKFHLYSSQFGLIYTQVYFFFFFLFIFSLTFSFIYLYSKKSPSLMKYFSSS